MPRYRLLLLDFDGTIVDSRPAIRTLLGRAAAAVVGAPVDSAIVDEAIDQGTLVNETVATVLDLCGLPEAEVAEHTPTVVAAYRESYLREGESHTTLFPEMLETIAALGRRGVAMAVVSNKTEDSIHDFIRRRGLSGTLATIFGDNGQRPGKPDPRLYAEHVRPIFPDIAPEETLMVGDAEPDLLFARAARIPACWARYGFGTPDACVNLAPEFAIDQPADLLTVVC